MAALQSLAQEFLQPLSTPYSQTSQYLVLQARVFIQLSLAAALQSSSHELPVHLSLQLLVTSDLQ